MAGIAIRSPEAEVDVTELSESLAQRSPRAALRFLDAAEAALAALAAMPGMGGMYETDNPQLAGLRVWPIPGFPNHLVFYREADPNIEIVRVLHGRRDLEDLLPP